jgi:hypothetical protein
MGKRSPITSPSEAVRIMQGVTQELQPPSHVPMEDMDWPFWHNVVAEFARAEWTEHQLELAAMLARTLANLEQEQRTLRREGFIAVRENGTTVENPRARAVKSLTGDILSLRRSLALHARAKSGDSRTDTKRREVAKCLEADLGDDLIARPTFQ